MKKQTLFLTVIPAIIIDLIINYFSLGQNDDIKIWYLKLRSLIS